MRHTSKRTLIYLCNGRPEELGELPIGGVGMAVF
jgi:hypothetical protein